jgi:Glutathione S-transferase, C-terminal domain
MTYTGNKLVSETLAKEYPQAGLWTNELADNLETTLLGSVEKLNSTDKTAIAEALGSINETMTFCMHPVGYSFTVGDFLLWGAIKGNSQISSDVLSGKYPEIERWYKEFMEKQPVTSQVAQFVEQLNVVLTSTTILMEEIQEQRS